MCKKPNELPDVSTVGVNNIDLNTATAYGNITGTDISAKGFCWDTLANPDLEKKFTNEGEGSQSFSSDINNLVPNKKYYVRAYATNLLGTVYGDNVNFTTPTLPVVQTSGNKTISYSSVTLGGSVSNTSLYTILETGICFDTRPNTNISKSKQASLSPSVNFVATLTGLNEKTLYYFRAYATYSFGTVYGAENNFTTSAAPLPPTVFTSTGTMTDFDGNVYVTVKIGSQTWMAENLKTTHYNDGTPIPFSNASNWPSNSQGVYGYFADALTYFNLYGNLYNYYVVIDPRGLAPPGWHIPTMNEWQILIDKLASVNSSFSSFTQITYNSGNWNSLSCTANNYSNMKVLPGGCRTDQSYDLYGGTKALFYSANNNGISYAEGYMLDNTCTITKINLPYNYGLSVRLIKD